VASIYDASAIEVLVGLEPVRKRPGMYTQTDRPNHLAQEVIDNSVDEVIAGFANKIDITLHEDSSLSVVDNGRGMPVDLHKEEKLPGVEVILTRLHAGAKFSSKNYMHSGGLHGVGVSVVNALSTLLQVEIRRDGKIYGMSFESGETSQPLEEIGKVAKNNTGTKVRFWPDEQYFDTVKFSVQRLKRLLLAKAVLCPDLEIDFKDEINPENNEHWHFEDGLGDYLVNQMNGSERIPDKPIIIHRKSDNSQIDWVVLWSPEADEAIAESYVNLIPTEMGGTHVNGLRTGMTDAVREFCEFQNLLPRGIRISAEDVWRNCNFILSVRMDDPQFTGQTKDRLTSRDIGKTITAVAKDAFSLWLNQHVPDAEKIAQLCIEHARNRQRASKQVQRRKLGGGPALPGKLTDCTSGNLETTELFLVEGDSAGGSARQARNRETQAILPLRGKILNTWEVDSNQVLASNEVHDLTIALGVDPGSAELSKLRYGKICILADADSDGAHIATLLCALFVKHFLPLVKDGRVYVAMPPLYRVDSGKDVRYALDDDELNGVVKELESLNPKKKISIQRFKGLGEMNPKQLKETTMHPQSRRLVQLTLEQSEKTHEILDMLLAKKKVAERKSWLTERGDKAQLQ